MKRILCLLFVLPLIFSCGGSGETRIPQETKQPQITKVPQEILGKYIGESNNSYIELYSDNTFKWVSEGEVSVSGEFTFN